ncbi:MAG: hypothetical protein ACHQRM_11905 [Bacteroidia bacterium]
MYLNKAASALYGTIATAACIFLFSCGSNHKDDQKEVASNKDTVAPAQKGETKGEQTSYTLPSPIQVASIFKKAGLTYYPNIGNAADNASKYNAGKINESLNLGVYSADLSYCALNKQNQDARNYLKASRQMADMLGLGKVFETDNLANRFDANLGKEDSLGPIIADMELQTDLILQEREQEYISATVFAGAWVESMYIGGKVFEKGKAKNVSAHLIEQMAIAQNIVKALKANESKDPGITGVMNDISSIRDTFENFAGVKSLNKDRDEVDFSKIEITEAEMTGFIKKIDEIRAKIVKG